MIKLNLRFVLSVNQDITYLQTSASPVSLGVKNAHQIQSAPNALIISYYNLIAALSVKETVEHVMLQI